MAIAGTGREWAAKVGGFKLALIAYCRSRAGQNNSQRSRKKHARRLAHEAQIDQDSIWTSASERLRCILDHGRYY
jgi:hypothetical protein